MLRMKEGETVKEYASKLIELVNKIRVLGEVFEDAKVIEKMMISLPAKFESKISAIEKSCDLKTLSVVELISKLQAQNREQLLEKRRILREPFKQSTKENKL